MRVLFSTPQSRRWFKLLKWITFLLISYFALKLVNLSQIRMSLAMIPTPTLMLFLGLMLLARIQYALRWKMISSSANIADLSTIYLLRVGLLSEFISIVLPSYLGGDGLRILKLRRYTDNNRDVLLLSLIHI